MQLVNVWIPAVLVAGALGPLQQAERSEEIATLVVAGDAEVATAPDRAVVTLGTTVQTPEASAAQQQVNEAMQRAIEAIAAAGVPRAQIQTLGLSLQPVYSQRPMQGRPGEEEQAPRIVGYRASNSVRVQIDDVALTGAVIDAGIGAGANELGGISFELRDDTTQRIEALRRAVANATQKAQALSQAAGVRLRGLQRIEEGGLDTVMPAFRRGGMIAMEASAPVEPGQVSVRAAVTLTYRIDSQTEVPPAGEPR
jgi:hypothetical protein